MVSISSLEQNVAQIAVPGDSLSFGLEIDKTSHTKAGEEQQKIRGGKGIFIDAGKVVGTETFFFVCFGFL